MAIRNYMEMYNNNMVQLWKNYKYNMFFIAKFWKNFLCLCNASWELLCEKLPYKSKNLFIKKFHGGLEV